MDDLGPPRSSRPPRGVGGPAHSCSGRPRTAASTVIDLKVKFSLKQSTVAAFFAVAFFVGSKVLERSVPVDGLILGLLVSGGIVLVLRPIQRFAEGLSTRPMGGVRDTPEYRRERKHPVYRAAIEGAMEDGVVSRERGRS